jgi:hypothetical protein
MGKGTVLSSTGEQYRVKILLDTTRVKQKLDKIEKDLVKRGEEKTAKQAQIDAAITLYGSKLEEYYALAETLAATEKDERKRQLALSQAMLAITPYKEQLDSLKAELLKIEAEILALKKDKEYLQNKTPEDPVVTAWCADATNDLKGEVGTIEVPGERRPNADILIRPGYEHGADYNKVRDGQIQPVIASTAGATFWNKAMLPGTQKWKPQYRFGKITAIDGDFCTVDLDPAYSSEQELSVNQTDVLNNVPIVYMECNGVAFTVGDKVVVEFKERDWLKPQVIGFQSNPKVCGGILTTPATYEHPRGWGYPMVDEGGAAINPPFGTQFTETFALPGPFSDGSGGWIDTSGYTFPAAGPSSLSVYQYTTRYEAKNDARNSVVLTPKTRDPDPEYRVGKRGTEYHVENLQEATQIDGRWYFVSWAGPPCGYAYNTNADYLAFASVNPSTYATASLSPEWYLRERDGTSVKDYIYLNGRKVSTAGKLPMSAKVVKWTTGPTTHENRVMLFTIAGTMFWCRVADALAGVPVWQEVFGPEAYYLDDSHITGLKYLYDGGMVTYVSSTSPYSITPGTLVPYSVPQWNENGTELSLLAVAWYRVDTSIELGCATSWTGAGGSAAWLFFRDGYFYNLQAPTQKYLVTITVSDGAWNPEIVRQDGDTGSSTDLSGGQKLTISAREPEHVWYEGMDRRFAYLTHDYQKYVDGTDIIYSNIINLEWGSNVVSLVDIQNWPVLTGAGQYWGGF